MKLSHVLSAAGLLFFAACGNRGGVQFDYVLLFNDAGQISAAPDCGTVNVDSVRFAVGNDLNGDGILDAGEEVDGFEQSCNQNDANGDGIIDANELGQVFVNRVIDAGTFDSFSIAFLDVFGDQIQWQPFDSVINAGAFTFQGAAGTTFTKGDITILPFNGDGAQVADELQVFFGF